MTKPKTTAGGREKTILDEFYGLNNINQTILFSLTKSRNGTFEIRRNNRIWLRYSLKFVAEEQFNNLKKRMSV